jgi:prephenate dehydrogenase
MWHDIFMANRVQMTLQIDQFKQTLDLLSSMIANNDSRSLEASLEHASAARKAWQLPN